MPQLPQTPQQDTDSDLNHRERATLHAVAQGGAEITCSCEPDLFLDGLACCDQATAHRLAREGLIAPANAGRPGERVPAVLTDAGKRALHALVSI
ncbi:uncharacterized protein YjhX (UPF0386 family) [Saccharomonospora amisosensis]|uniref:Uncharacterized protein YjhX (UPF0386 family) n=1 Tax=Saccharomonospora amisosensis TaxID=1128677 RepID=A0A7X5UT12_9PSEU|nr:hypothetical protein [Saccharomonospora amisosensis]NIJ13699.1 uncharacterized protein YjhX (UPF0386 family) [Saccharomonospora amisosensis]